jgi:hypothetical protein
MKILKNCSPYGDAYYNLNVLDSFYFLDNNKTLTLGSGDNQRELKLETSKYQECKTQLFDFILNTEIVMDISNYVVKR